MEARATPSSPCFAATSARSATAMSRTQETHRRSMRLMAVALRAEVAAKQGDAAATRASIDEGLALWAEIQGHPAGVIGIRSVESFHSWERWARDWLARASGPVA